MAFARGRAMMARTRRPTRITRLPQEMIDHIGRMANIQTRRALYNALNRPVPRTVSNIRSVAAARNRYRRSIPAIARRPLRNLPSVGTPRRRRGSRVVRRRN